ncbi:hypothetical protein DDF62_05005 [Caulobacter radicis]|nr:hypothetical protein DDF62_05005 [Caulobacter radicis]
MLTAGPADRRGRLLPKGCGAFSRSRPQDQAESHSQVAEWSAGGEQRADPLSSQLPSFPPLWREPLYQPRKGGCGGVLSTPLASHVSAEPGVPATRAGMTGVRGEPATPPPALRTAATGSPPAPCRKRSCRRPR